MVPRDQAREKEKGKEEKARRKDGVAKELGRETGVELPRTLPRSEFARIFPHQAVAHMARNACFGTTHQQPTMDDVSTAGQKIIVDQTAQDPLRGARIRPLDPLPRAEAPARARGRIKILPRPERL